ADEDGRFLGGPPHQGARLAVARLALHQMPARLARAARFNDALPVQEALNIGKTLDEMPQFHFGPFKRLLWIEAAVGTCRRTRIRRAASCRRYRESRGARSA